MTHNTIELSELEEACLHLARKQQRAVVHYERGKATFVRVDYVAPHLIDPHAPYLAITWTNHHFSLVSVTAVGSEIIHKFDDKDTPAYAAGFVFDVAVSMKLRLAKVNGPDHAEVLEQLGTLQASLDALTVRHVAGAEVAA